jgi:surface carbohydrate biosynthesis protein (TIGR04326 family)
MKDIPESRRHVIIYPPLKTSLNRVLRQLKGSNFRWAYLGEDVAKAITIEQQIGDKGQRIEIAEQLQKVAHSLRQPYIDYIGKLSLKNHSILWWVGSLSEKNPWISKTFLYACYIRLCQNLLESSGLEAIVLIGENKALRKCLSQNLSRSNKGKVIQLESLTYTIINELRNVLGIALYKGYFILNSIYRLLLARYYRLNRIPRDKLRAGKGLVLIHTWVDQRSFDANGKYQETFFGDLAHHLGNKGKNVIIVPYILRTVPYLQIIRKLARSGESFLVPESFLTIVDILRAFGTTISSLPRQSAYPDFEGIDISEIIYDDVKRDWAGIRTALSLLHYETVKHWKSAQIPIDTFIYTYENHVWEKAYCIALREFYPSAKLIGYQHASVPKMLLNFFFAQDESLIMPFPDKVITNGKYIEGLFTESGYDPKKVVCGGAIRYKSATKKSKAAHKKDTQYPVILVTPSIDRNETIELIWKVLAAFRQTNEYRIILKLHPVIPYPKISGYIGSLPENFIIADKPVSELLKESHVLLYTSSATSIEALSLGVPVLHIESDFIIDRDNLSDFPSSIRQSAKNKGGIVRMTAKILKTDEKELSKQRVMWENVVVEVFGPVDESVFDLFL